MEAARRQIRLAAGVVLASVLATTAGAQPPTLTLAVELAAEGNHAEAALEFRRLAVERPADEAQGGYYWAAAFEYWKAGETTLAEKMLDRAEDAAPALSVPALLLRGENACAAQKWDEAGFYFESLLRGEAGAEEKTLASRRLAATRLRQRDLAGAEEALARAPEPQAEARAALETYVRGRDKNPRLGGLLGLIPGFGYFYAGEWANGWRSIILNSLFLYGLADTAGEDQWGAFAVIAFFEFTWYSGSIYGGVDAAHRFNRKRLEAAVSGIQGGAWFEPDLTRLPAVSLKFRF